jgi:hypothetical protein
MLRTLDVLLDRQAFMKQAGFQFDSKRDLYAIFGYDRIITGRQFRDEYARGGLAKVIIDTYPEATWRGGVEVYEDEDPKKETAFEKTFNEIDKKHRIFFKCQAADVLAQLSTYSVMLIGVPGDLNEEMPRGNPTQLLYLQPFWGGGGPGDQSRGTNMGVQSMDTDVTIETFDVDPASERFGEPLTYRIRRTDISSPLLARSVHWSRIIHIPAKGALDSNVYGPPGLECVWNLLFDLEKITGGTAESFFQRAKQVLHANIDKDVTFTDPQMAAMKSKFEEYQNNITTFIPTRGVDVKFLESSSAKSAAEADVILTQIAGTTKIPKRILTGSEMGELASAQDAANFDSRVKDRRSGYAEPVIMRPLVDRLIEYGYLPTPAQYEVGWPVEETMDEKGKSDFAMTLANVNKTFDGVVFTEDEIRDMAFDKEPLPTVDTNELLSESQKAEIAVKLSMVNKQMGITVFTDDEIRDITYGFAPLSDDEKVPIGAPERISVTAPPPIGEDGKPIPQDTLGQPIAPAKPVTVPGKPVKPPVLKAAEDRGILAILEAAIVAKDRATIDRILFGAMVLTPDAAITMLSQGQGTEALVLAKQFVIVLGDRLPTYDIEQLYIDFEDYRQRHGTGFDGRRDA